MRARRSRSSAPAGGRVSLLGECKWTAKPLSVKILQELDDYKLPALRQSGAKLHADPEIVLFARSGFTKGLREAAAGTERLHLIDLDDLVPGS